MVLMRGMGLLVLTTLAAHVLAGEPVSFIACPIYRDVDQGPKSGCWLATDPVTGTRYDVGLGRSKPQWGREVLVEGVLSDAADVCGGAVLEPVRVAVLDTGCNKHMLPAEGYPGRSFQLPAAVMQQSWAPRDIPPPPYAPQQYVIFFGFGSSFPLYQYSEVILEKIALYALASHPRRVVVTGTAATDAIVVSGRSLAEAPALAKARADKIVLALQRLGVPPSIIEQHIQLAALPVEGGDDGLVEPSRRRVTISIEF